VSVSQCTQLQDGARLPGHAPMTAVQPLSECS